MKETVLIIDDESELRSFLSRLISLEGYKIQSAEDGKSGLTLTQKEDFGIVVTDVRLLDINGIELIYNLKKINPLTEVIVLTAYSTIEDGVRAVNFLTNMPMLNLFQHLFLIQNRSLRFRNKFGMTVLRQPLLLDRSDNQLKKKFGNYDN